MAERITQAELARVLGVNRSTVNRGVKAGRLTPGKDKLFDRDEALRQWRETESPMPHHQARKAQIEQQKAEAVIEDEADDLPNLENASALLRYQTYKLQKAKAEKAAMEVDQLSGELIERSKVNFVLDDIGETERALSESRADRWTARLTACRGDANLIHKALEDLSHDESMELSEHRKRRANEL